MKKEKSQKENTAAQKIAAQRYFLCFYPDRNAFSECDAAEFGHLLAAVAFLLFETVLRFIGIFILLGNPLIR